MDARGLSIAMEVPVRPLPLLALTLTLALPVAAAAKPWEHSPTLDELMQGTSMAGIPYTRQDNAEGLCSLYNPVAGAMPGFEGFRPRDLDKAVKVGALRSYTWGYHDAGVRIHQNPTPFLDDFGQLSVVPAGGDFEAIDFRFWTHQGETVTVEAIIAYPRWDAGMDLQAQLAALGLQPTQEGALVKKDEGMLLRTQRKTHRVVLAPDDDGEPLVRAVVWQCNPAELRAFREHLYTTSDMRRALDEDRRGELRDWYRVTSLYPLDALEHYVSRAREILGDELGVMGRLQARYDQATGFMERLAILGSAYLESQGRVCRDDQLGLDRAALLPEAEQRLASVAGQPAATAGWSLVKLKLEKNCDEAPRAALGESLAALQREVVGVPTTESQDPYVRNMLYQTVLFLEHLPIHGQLKLKYKQGAGPAPVLALGEQRARLTSRSYEDTKRYREGETTREWTEWKASLDHQEHLYRMATEEMERRSQFLTVYTAYESGACWETEQAHWYDVTREVDCTGWGRSESWTEVDSAELRAFERAVQQREWVLSEARKLLENEPDKGEKHDYSCEREVQEWAGSVEQPFTVSVGGQVVQRGSQSVEIEPIQLVRNVRCHGGGASSDVDQWVASVADLTMEPVGLKDLVEPIGEAAREGMRQALGRNLEPQLAGKSPEEAAWLRWFFGQDPAPGDERHVPLEFMAAW